MHHAWSSQNNDVCLIQNHICRLRRYSLFTSTWCIRYITTHRYFITVETEDITIFLNPYNSAPAVSLQYVVIELLDGWTSNSRVFKSIQALVFFFRGICFLHMKYLLSPSTLDKRRESPDFRTSRQSARKSRFRIYRMLHHLGHPYRYNTESGNKKYRTCN